MARTKGGEDEVILTLRLRRIATARRESKDGETIGVETLLTFTGATVTERDIAALNGMQHERELQLRIVAVQRPLLGPELGMNGPGARPRSRARRGGGAELPGLR